MDFGLRCHSAWMLIIIIDYRLLRFCQLCWFAEVTPAHSQWELWLNWETPTVCLGRVGLLHEEVMDVFLKASVEREER